MPTYELKKTNPAQVTLNEDGSATIVQGFTTGVVGTPDSYGMLAGDNISVNVASYATKLPPVIEAEVLAAVNAFIANKYPATP